MQNTGAINGVKCNAVGADNGEIIDGIKRDAVSMLDKD